MKNIWDELYEKEQEENKELKAIRLSGKKKIVDSNTFGEKFSPGHCRFCMNYNDKNDRCKLGINAYRVEFCDSWDYLYTTQNE